jgi:Cu/Ag efflux pump CusA
VLVGRVHSEDGHPVSRFLIRAYEPVCRWSLRNKWAVIAVAAALFIATVPAFLALGSEFMPPLYEEALFYMPSTMPGISIGEAQRVLQVTEFVAPAVILALCGSPGPKLSQSTSIQARHLSRQVRTRRSSRPPAE